MKELLFLNFGAWTSVQESHEEGISFMGLKSLLQKDRGSFTVSDRWEQENLKTKQI